MEKNQVQPWWKFGHVWLVLAGPAVVVVASFITLYLAIRTPDPVITDEFRNKSSQGAGAESLAPAMQARNHAATGVPVPSKP
jgi:hypothetical protein